VSVPRVSVRILSAMQCDWLSHARPAPFPFTLFLFPGCKLFVLEDYYSILSWSLEYNVFIFTGFAMIGLKGVTGNAW